jgi:tetratricopeptide (TPR) repeat protein
VPTWPNWVWVSSAKNWHDSYQALGRYGEAEPLYRRSLAILEKALGPKHPSVATNLENYAAMLRETGRTAEADKMEARAKAIRVKRAK